MYYFLSVSWLIGQTTIYVHRLPTCSEDMFATEMVKCLFFLWHIHFQFSILHLHILVISTISFRKYYCGYFFKVDQHGDTCLLIALSIFVLYVTYYLISYQDQPPVCDSTTMHLDFRESVHSLVAARQLWRQRIPAVLCLLFLQCSVGVLPLLPH
jgi:hypothetical protein